MPAYGGIPQSRVSPYEPYKPGEDFGAWRQRNPLRVAMPGTRMGTPGVGGPMPMFFPQTQSRIGPRYDPNRIIEPSNMQFRPQTPTPTETPFEPRVATPIRPPFEQQTPTGIFERQTLKPIEPPFEPRVPTPIDSPLEPQTPTPIETPPGPTQPTTIPDVLVIPPIEGAFLGGRVAVGISSPGTRFRRMAPYSLKNVISRPAVFDYMINTYGNQTVRLILLKAGLDPEEYFGAEGE